MMLPTVAPSTSPAKKKKKTTHPSAFVTVGLVL